MRYGLRLGCRFGAAHDIEIIHENPVVKWEMCKLCGERFRWNKGYKGRTNNTEYLKAHVRNFAQPDGATAMVYNRIYAPEKCVIAL
jgi:hypothetical protein